MIIMTRSSCHQTDQIATLYLGIDLWTKRSKLTSITSAKEVPSYPASIYSSASLLSGLQKKLHSDLAEIFREG